MYLKKCCHAFQMAYLPIHTNGKDGKWYWHDESHDQYRGINRKRVIRIYYCPFCGKELKKYKYKKITKWRQFFTIKSPYCSPKAIFRWKMTSKISLLKGIYTWIRVNLRSFYWLHFKECILEDVYQGHFINQNGICMRCKKSIMEIDREIYLRKLIEEKKRGIFTNVQIYNENKKDFECHECHDYPKAGVLFMTLAKDYNETFAKHETHDVLLCKQCFNQVASTHGREMI